MKRPKEPGCLPYPGGQWRHLPLRCTKAHLLPRLARRPHSNGPSSMQRRSTFNFATRHQPPPRLLSVAAPEARHELVVATAAPTIHATNDSRPSQSAVTRSLRSIENPAAGSTPGQTPTSRPLSSVSSCRSRARTTIVHDIARGCRARRGLKIPTGNQQRGDGNGRNRLWWNAPLSTVGAGGNGPRLRSWKRSSQGLDDRGSAPAGNSRP